MKNLKSYLFLITVFVTSVAFGADTWFPEGIQVKTGSTFGAKATADTKAIVDMRSTTKGLLPPRMTTAQRGAIASPTEGLQVFDTDLNSMMSYTGSAWEELASLAGTETFTNKTHTDPIVSDAVRLSEQGSTPSTPASTFKKLYAKNDGKLYTLNSSGTETEVGAGSGEGGINYITNGKAETDTSGWATYADAAATTPVDGTGGSPSSTWTRSTSSPMRGTASFLWTKSANNRQGEGASFAFTIDRADLGRQLAITGVYEVASGTYATADMALYVYDVTNATLIQPSGYQIISVGTQYEFVNVVFQAATNSSSYRLIIHTASTSASAYTLKFDNFGVGPLVKSVGVPYADTTAYTPTLTTSGGGAITLNATAKVDPNGLYYRDGEYLYLQVTFKNGSGGAASGSAGSVQIGIPSICTPNTAKLATSVGGVRVDGKGNVGTTTFIPAEAFISGSNILLMPSGLTSYLAVSNLAASYYVAMQAKIPCTGWSGNTVASDSASQRVVAFKAGTSSTSLAYNASTVMTFATAAIYDTHGGWNGSNAYTVRVPGKYKVAARTQLTSSTPAAANRFIYLAVRKSGVIQAYSDYDWSFNTTAREFQKEMTATFDAVAGDTIDVQVFQNLTGSAVSVSGSGPSENYFSVEMIQGPQQITASDLILARYTTAAGQSISGAGTANLIDFGTKDFDTTNSVTTGASWKFTAPAPGYYEICTSVVLAGSTGWADTEGIELIIYKNGSSGHRISYRDSFGSGSSVLAAGNGCGIVQLNATEYADLRVSQTSGGSIAMFASASYNWVTVKRLNAVQ